MTYREPLPEGCPPDEADEITQPRTVFRLVRANPPTDDDFMSHRAKYPHKEFENMSECQVLGVSVALERRSLERRLKRENMRGMLRCRVELNRGAGFIQQTGRKRVHYTWWPLAEFDILANSIIEP